MIKYSVRQYRPSYFSGFKNEIYHNMSYDKILTVPFCENFKHSGFTEFSISPYGEELIIEAHYENGKHHVCGFAIDETKPFAKNWRYDDAAEPQQ